MSVFPNPGPDQCEFDHLLDLLATSAHDSPAARRARNQLVERFLPMATHLASRYRYKGQNIDDLVQVARMALVSAVDRLDPQRRAEFVAFAAATIHGELKKHFRDTAWMVRPPRRLQERWSAISAASDQLKSNGTEPTVTELARRLELCPAEVKEALMASAGYRATSLDAPDGGRPEYPSSARSTEDVVEARDRWRQVSKLVRQLPDRNRRVLYLRYFEEMTQAEIAACVGVSQMHVSRILSRSLDRLSAQVDEHERAAG